MFCAVTKYADKKDRRSIRRLIKRQLTERLITQRRITKGRITERRITEGQKKGEERTTEQQKLRKGENYQTPNNNGETIEQQITKTANTTEEQKLKNVDINFSIV